MRALFEKVPGETWGSFFRLVFGTWLCLWICAALHNQYLIRICPEHFTVWHYRIPFTRDYTLLGISYAFAATSSPGLFLGMAFFFVGRFFSWPRMPVRSMLIGVFVVWAAVEVCSLTAGYFVWKSKQGLYPDWVYPDDSLGLLITQTIQVTAYLSGMVFSLILLAWIVWTRWRWTKAARASEE